MRIAIMGSGGLGGYFGARLVQGGAADVHFVARGKHLEAMRRDGLRIEGPEPIHVQGSARDRRSAEIGVVDVVMLCVKLWDTERRSSRSGRWSVPTPQSSRSRTAS